MSYVNVTADVTDAAAWFTNSSDLTDTSYSFDTTSNFTDSSFNTTDILDFSNIANTFINSSNITSSFKGHPDVTNTLNSTSTITDATSTLSNFTNALNNSSNITVPFRRSNIPDSGAKARLVFTSSIILVIWVSSTLPAAAIWRNVHLHRASYFYVMTLCLLDCFLGCSIGAMMFTIGINRGIPNTLCIIYEALLNGTLHTISALMLALSRDRFLSVLDPIAYRVAVRTSVVWRHLAFAALYGLTQGGGVLVASRWYFGAGLDLNSPLCDAFDWLLDPRNRYITIASVGGNIVVDLGTIVYNARIMYCAWRAKKEIAGSSAQRSLTEEAQRRRNMKIVVFTLKLACLFLGCSLPYKVAMLMYGLGLDIPRLVFELLGLIRILYHVVDGWIVCTNQELLEAMKLMLCQRGNTNGE